MRNWKLILGIFLLTVLSACIMHKNIEPLANSSKGNLYLLLEANGFNIPEFNATKQIMDPTLAQSKFNKLVVVANSAKYKNSNDGHIMTDQWDNTLVGDLGLPVEKWAFVCCSSKVTPANTLITMLTTQFPDIKGFLIDSEDDGSYPHSIEDFVKVFNTMGSKYKYAIVGGLRNTIPPKNKYGIVFDKFFSEAYTEGNLAQYNFYKGLSQKVDGSTCVDMTNTGVEKFWSSVKAKLGMDDAIVPTVCGSGDCQEELFGDDCFDERLSNRNIDSLIRGNTIGRKDFAIWYGSGQQFSCKPSRDCLRLDQASCNTNLNCTWSPYKKNPNTHQKGVCFGNLANTQWGCATTW